MKTAVINLMTFSLITLAILLYITIGNILYPYASSMYFELNPFYILSIPAIIADKATGSPFVAMISTLLFFWAIIKNPSFRNLIFKIAVYPAILIYRALRSIILMLLGKWNWVSKWNMVFQTWRRFFLHYKEMWDITGVMNTHFEFLWYLLFPFALTFYSTKWSWKAKKSAFFEDRPFFDQLNSLVYNHIGECVYLTDLSVDIWSIKASFMTWKMPGEVMKVKLEKLLTEVYRILPWYDPKNEKFTSEILIESDCVSLSITRKSIWADSITFNTDEKFLEIPRRHFLWWFSSGDNPKDITWKMDSIQSCSITSCSGGGKDNFGASLLYMLLWEKLRDKDGKNPINIKLYDSKNIDWIPYEGRENHGIYLYKKKDGEFWKQFEDDLQEVRKLASKVGKYGNVTRYNQEIGHIPIPETYLFLNEALSLFADENSQETKRISSALISILAEGRASWYHVILISQSLRWDTLKGSFGRMRTNIDTVFAGKMSSRNEVSITWAWLDEADKKRLMNIPKHTFVMIQDNTIKTEFKPYFLDSLSMEKFLDKHFPKRKSLLGLDEPEKVLSPEAEFREILKDPVIREFVKNSAITTYEYHWRSAQEAGISETKYRRLGKILKILWYVRFQIGKTPEFIKPIVGDINRITRSLQEEES